MAATLIVLLCVIKWCCFEL